MPGFPGFDVNVLPRETANFKDSGFQSNFGSQSLALSLPEIRSGRSVSSDLIINEIDNSMPGFVQNVSVWGTIRTELGAITNRERIIFHSSSLGKRYVTYSNSNGYFYIGGMTPAKDYRMRVTSTGMFQQYARENLDLSTEQTGFSVVLRELPVGALNGTLINSDGIPVSGFGIKIRSLEKDLWVATTISDTNGGFRVEQVPFGGLEFSSTFGAALRITGHAITGDLQSPLTLVVDQGAYEINGIVYDQLSNPLVGASVVLDWVSSDGTIRSVVSRQGVTDFSGKFSFGGLGSGEHDLTISIADGSTYRQVVDVGAYGIGLKISLKQTATNY